MPVEIHQIAEHHRQVSPLAGGVRSGCGSRRPHRRHGRECKSGRSRRVVEVGDRAQHLPAIAKDDTQIFQVLIGEVTKNREINAVFGKGLRVLGHAERFEPIRNLLHRGH